MMIILGIIGAGMVWGLPGMFAVVPLLAMFNIMAERIPKLYPYAFLLGEGGTRRHSLTFGNMRKFIQQLQNAILKRIRKIK
jgi:hypothetical protein